MKRPAEILWVLALVGCGHSLPDDRHAEVKGAEKRGTADPANQLTYEELSTGALRVEVPAGEWRILHLDWNSLAANAQQVQVRIVSEGQPGAHPWGGFGDQVFDAKSGAPLISSMYLQGFRSGEPDSFGYQFAFTGTPPEDYSVETVYLIGSNDALSTFYIGVVPNIDTGIVLPEPSPGGVLRLISGEGQTEDHRPVLEEFKRRPLISAHLESGSGGFGVAYKRYYAPNGDLIEVRAGRAQFTAGALADPGMGIKGEQSLGIQLDEILPGRGVVSLLALGYPQAGAAHWSYHLGSPGLKQNQTGYTIEVSGISTGVNTGGEDSTKAGGILNTILQGPVDAGTLHYDIDYTFTGREGGGVDGNASGASFQIMSAFINFFGYINADFSKLYGWNVEKNVFN